MMVGIASRWVPWEEGRFEAMQYFDKIDEVKLTWADVLFDDEKEVVITKKEAKRRRFGAP